jgi:release factor glutamine methyltransferase
VTVREALDRGARRLLDAGIENGRREAEWIVGHVLDLSRSGLYADTGRELSAAEADRAEALFSRRESREPLAYVLGEWAFRRLTLKTDARALVPRPETEVVVERCLALLDGVTTPRILDVGTGSGAIALALKHERPDAHLTATDISADAIALARENAARNGLEVELIETDLLAGVEGPFDLVVSNPPYVLPGELAGLEPEVRDWEPELALLDAGQTAALAADARAVLDGWLVLEVHERFAKDVVAQLEVLTYAAATITVDLVGRERVVEARWEPTTTSRGQ